LWYFAGLFTLYVVPGGEHLNENDNCLAFDCKWNRKT
jgi:hypothetical protein